MFLHQLLLCSSFLDAQALRLWFDLQVENNCLVVALDVIFIDFLGLETMSFGLCYFTFEISLFDMLSNSANEYGIYRYMQSIFVHNRPVADCPRVTWSRMPTEPGNMLFSPQYTRPSDRSTAFVHALVRYPRKSHLRHLFEDINSLGASSNADLPNMKVFIFCICHITKELTGGCRFFNDSCRVASMMMSSLGDFQPYNFRWSCNSCGWSD